MVNNRTNLSAYEGAAPTDEQSDRTIPGGPLYEKEAVLAVLNQGAEAVRPWTQKCISDLKRLELDHEDVIQLIKTALSSGHFRNAEWCLNKPGGAWAACDSYQVTIAQWIEAAHRQMHIDYYVKFAIGKTGNVLLTISCHLS